MIAWRKSSRSDDTGGHCVELGRLPGEGVGLRDSKAPEGGRLVLSADGFAELVARVKHDRLS